jgi:hypothetical protein
LINNKLQLCAFPCVKVGRLAKYRASDIAAFIAANTQGGRSSMSTNPREANASGASTRSVDISQQCPGHAAASQMGRGQSAQLIARVHRGMWWVANGGGDGLRN